MAYNRSGAPFGDIFSAGMPKTDRWIANKQQERRNDELYSQRQMENLDKEFSSQLGNGLNIDIPEITDKWSKYREIKKELLTNRRLQGNPTEYNKTQIAANRALGDFLDITNESSQRKAALAYQQKDLIPNKYRYDPEANQKLLLALNTPSSFARLHPEIDDARYQGASKEFSNAIIKATGTDKPPRELSGSIVTAIDPITNKVQKAWGYNDPSAVKTNLDAQLSNPQFVHDGTYELHNTPPEVLNKINQDFANLPASKWKAWGYESAPNLEPRDPNNAAEVWNSFVAKKQAVDSPVSWKTGKPEPNEYAREELRRKAKIELQSLGISQREGAQKRVAMFRKSVGLGAGKSGTNADNYSVVESVIKDLEDKAKAGGAGTYIEGGTGKEEQVYNLPLTKEIRSLFSQKIDKDVHYPNEVNISQNGDWFPVFYKTDSNGKYIKENGKNIVDNVNFPKTVYPRSEVVLALGKRLGGVKEAVKAATNMHKKEDKKELSAEDILKKYNIPND